MARSQNKYQSNGKPHLAKRRRPSLSTLLIFGISGAVMLYGGARWLSHHGPKNAAVEVLIPSAFSAEAIEGQAVFAENCASCHGVNAGGGTGNGPPLVHKIYEPSHHGDGSFYNAVANGVTAHHWPFGNMPAQGHVPQNDVSLIISYIRELQRANGIN